MLWGHDVISRRVGAVRYDEVGDGPPLLLVGTGGWHEFRCVLAVFAKFYRCVVVSGELDDLVERLALGCVDILGYGVGAHAAAGFAARNPHRIGKLVLAGPDRTVAPARIDTPALVTWGRADGVCTALLDAMPDAEVHLFANCGHGVIDDQPAMFADTALAFLLRKTCG